jgi:hypothetical protein
LKSVITSLLIYLFFSTASAQILNPSFEDWNTFDPVNWSSTDDDGSIDAITESSDAHDGSSSVRMGVVDLSGFGIPPYLFSIDDNGNYYTVSQKHGSLKGWYKFSPVGNDVMYIVIGMLDSDSSAIGAGAVTITNAITNWTEFNIPIFYTPGSPNPVATLITIHISNGTGFANVGSFALIDQLSFTDPSAVEQINGLPQDYNLSQNYPNPFNPTTKIEYNLPEQSVVQLKVYDILGNEVASLVNEEQSAGTYRADFIANNLASGFYVAQLRAGNFTKTIKMTLMK